MKALVFGLVAVASLGLAGCNEDEPVSAPVARDAGKTGSAAKATPAADVLGRWGLDADGFVDENWEMLSQGARKGTEALRKERDRIATLRMGERLAAEQALAAKIDAMPLEQRAGVRAALGTPEEFKAWARGAIAERMSVASVELEFSAGGVCKIVMAIPGKDREDGKGTWTQQGERVTVKMTTVNGKPAKGKDAKAVSMTVRGDKLIFSPAPGGPKVVSRRAV